MDGNNGLLKEKDMGQLEAFIGTGPKQFTLLYKITRDGCIPAKFHEKCDGQGATVTVLHNPQGTVYGGYVSKSWDSPSSWQYVKDDNAFLFQSMYNGVPSWRRFIAKCNCTSNTLYNNKDYGPTFGNHALIPFSSEINQSRGIFALKGYITIDNVYDFQGLSKDQVNNNTMDVTELEVYKVTDGERTYLKDNPWRETPKWNQQYLTELQEAVVNYKPVCAPAVPEARILLVGPVGAGKSSFYNTVNSVFRERISHKAISGSTDNSLTFALKQYQVRISSGAHLNFRLCDTPGLEEGRGIDTTEFSYILGGNLPQFYKFEPDCPIDPECLVKQPTLAQKIHCVAFVVDSTTLDVIPTGVLQKIKRFQKLAYKKEIPQVVLFTKVDKLCKYVKDDVENVLKSSVVETAIDKTAEVFRIPRGNVLPVKNYENETELKENVSISAMLALRQMLHFADDFLDIENEQMAVQERGIQRLDIKD